MRVKYALEKITLSSNSKLLVKKKAWRSTSGTSCMKLKTISLTFNREIAQKTGKSMMSLCRVNGRAESALVPIRLVLKNVKLAMLPELK
jgi:hypothetical protein